MPTQLMTGSIQGPGSEYLLIVNPDGTIGVSGTVNSIISGTIVIGSVSAHVDSIYIQSGANIDLGSAWTNVGSVVVSGTIPVTFSAGSVQVNAGSVAITTTPLPVSGAMQNLGGSFAITTSPLPISGTITSLPSWGGVGSIISSGISSVTGSVALYNYNAWAGVGSVNVSGGILGSVAISTSPVPISGAMGNLGGSFAITTSPLPISGATQIFGVSGTEVHPFVAIGSRLLVAGSIQTYSPIGVGSVITSGITSITGSVALYNYAAWTGVGSVVISGALSTAEASVYALSGIIANTGSLTLVGYQYNGSTWVPRLSNGSSLMVDIGNIGSVAITTSPLPISGALGNVAGSVAITTGSVNVYGALTATNPSVYMASGIIANTGSVTLVGADFNGSVWPLRMVTGSNLLIAGSVSILSNPVPISGALSNLAGSFAITTIPVPISGTITIGNATTGSLHLIGSIGAYGQATLGSVHLIGSIGVYGQNTLGSVHNIGSIGVYGPTGSLHLIGSIGVYGQNTLGSVHNIGSIGVYGQATVGSVHTIGSIQIYGAGSVRQVEIPWQIKEFKPGPKWSGAQFTGSFTGSNIITPGAGSNLFLKGFTASAIIATNFVLRFSGGTATPIGQWSLPNSGTMAMNLLGMEPSGAVNQPLAVGMLNAGSIQVSFATLDSL